jgi:CDP-diacylglycerol---glycerol-3-phosphate 3-phosphatidyltransferase
MSGKVKMVLQSVTILIILLYVNYFERSRGPIEFWARVVRDGFIVMTIIFTVLSAVTYVRKAVVLFQRKELPTIGSADSTSTSAPAVEKVV